MATVFTKDGHPLQGADAAWDLDLVQSMLSKMSTQTTLKQTSAVSALACNPRLQHEAVSQNGGAIGDLSPVLELLRDETEVFQFRELEPLPIPSWPTAYTAGAPGKDSYASDGVAIYQSQDGSRRKVFLEDCTAQHGDAETRGEATNKSMHPSKTRDLGASRKTAKQMQATSLSVSDGEARKAVPPSVQRLKPAIRAASHQALLCKVTKQATVVSPPKTDEPAKTVTLVTSTDTTGAVQKLSKKALKRLKLNVLDSVSPNIRPRNPRTRSAPSTVDSWLQRDKVNRDLVFRVKLIDSFPEDRSSLSQTVPFKDCPPLAGLHVFIDYSNIWVGFMNHISSILGTNQLSFQHRQLSFESLVFLLQRGRPVGRCILGGSLPWLQAFDTARRVGYECNILEKVMKDRSATAQHSSNVGEYKSKPTSDGLGRQISSLPLGEVSDNDGIRLETRDPSSVSAPVLQTSSQNVSQTSSPVRSHSASCKKWVEQGVDEILQMKMLESLVDCRQPSIMVLATGDGAKAEYSAGFTKVVERALNLGWQLELVCWESSLNPVYKKFGKRWPRQFRFIALERFAEYMLEPWSDDSAG